jgi:hypothetical protein
MADSSHSNNLNTARIKVRDTKGGKEAFHAAAGKIAKGPRAPKNLRNRLSQACHICPQRKNPKN